MTLPNFLIVGAEKAGTTTLAATLSRHPDIFMCDPKEPRFFSHNWHKGLDWYKSLFVTGEGFQTVGEASPAYTCAPVISDVPQRIYDVLGDVKYIYIVRHPVDRIISHYRHAIQYRWIPASTPLEHSYELAPSLKNCSRYYYQVERYFPYTKRSQWHIVVLEELIQSPQPVMDALFEFLGLPRHVISELPHENKSNNNHTMPIGYRYFHYLKPLVPNFLAPVVKRQLNYSGKKVDRLSVSADTYERLSCELGEDIRKMSQFAGRDLGALWEIS